jgi:hypothetical protein
MDNRDMKILKSLPKNFSVKITNKLDFDMLMIFFYNNNNIEWASGRQSIEKTYDASCRDYINYNIEGDEILYMSDYPVSYNELSISDIIKSKYVKTKNTEIDPFDEEDWGYTAQ